MGVNPATTLRERPDIEWLIHAADDLDAYWPELAGLARGMAATKLAEHEELCRQIETGDAMRAELARIGGAA